MLRVVTTRTAATTIIGGDEIERDVLGDHHVGQHQLGTFLTFCSDPAS